MRLFPRTRTGRIALIAAAAASLIAAGEWSRRHSPYLPRHKEN